MPDRPNADRRPSGSARGRPVARCRGFLRILRSAAGGGVVFVGGVVAAPTAGNHPQMHKRAARHSIGQKANRADRPSVVIDGSSVEQERCRARPCEQHPWCVAPDAKLRQSAADGRDYPRRARTASLASAGPAAGTSGTSALGAPMLSFLRNSASILAKISRFSFRKPRVFSRPCPMRSPE